MIIFSRVSPHRFTSQGTTAPQVRGQAIAMCDFCSTFALAFVGDGFANESLFPGQRLLALRISSSPHSSIALWGPQRRRTARSSHVHRITIAHAGLCSHYAAFQLACGSVPFALRACQGAKGRWPLKKFCFLNFLPMREEELLI